MLTPNQLRNRRRARAFEIPDYEIDNMVELVAGYDYDGVYLVDGFGTSPNRYEVEVENGEMTFCGCMDFQNRQIACKHMYLLKRFDENMLVFEETYFSPSPEPSPSPPPLTKNQQKAFVILDDLKAFIDHYQSEPWDVSRSDVKIIEHYKEQIIEAFYD